MLDPAALIAIALIFLLAGSVKGVIGLGLPTVALALLAVMVGLQPAMALLLVPSFVTNLWQAFSGGNSRMIVVRTWPFLLAATLTVWIGAQALPRVDVALLAGLLGVLLVAYAAANLVGRSISIPRRWEIWAGPVFGAANGVLTGMTGSFVVPGVLYLQAIGLPREALVQAMGILFTASTAALAVALGGQRLLTVELATVSAAAVAPAIIGMVLGRRLRQTLSEASFRRAFFWSLLALGVYIVVRSVR
ncbi:MAG: sulfite exporter TauE/SafE family protein [Rhodospirillales bacterium]|nr:sulfite exporter TauE/SafE family protein [Rhodospirillales bacterium]